MKNIIQADPNKIPRYVGISTFARLPYYESLDKVDIGEIGIPFDSGCTFRSGARFGPEAIRKSSRLLRAYNPDQDKYPFLVTVFIENEKSSCFVLTGAFKLMGFVKVPAIFLVEKTLLNIQIVPSLLKKLE